MVRASRALVIDVLCVLIFVVIGRRNHDEGSALGGVVQTAAPFLIALALAWVGKRGRYGRAAGWAFGVIIWLSTAGFGLILRRVLFQQSTALAFVIVAMLFLGLALVGWRFIASLFSRRHVEAR